MDNYPYASMRDCFDMSAYFVVGPQDCKGRPVTDVVDDALRGGATFIQLRAKDADAKDITEMARDIAQIIEDNGKSDSVAFVIDDRVDVVWQARNKGIKVDGVHIGQTDMEPREARALLGEDAIVGLSAETESLVKLTRSRSTRSARQANSLSSSAVACMPTIWRCWHVPRPPAGSWCPRSRARTIRKQPPVRW